MAEKLSRGPWGAKVTGVGAYMPERVVSNEEISTILSERRDKFEKEDVISRDDPRRIQFESDSTWIEQRTGVLERRHAAQGEATSDLAVRAIANALDESGLAPEKVGFIVFATVTPDHHATPPTVSIIADRLSLGKAASCGGANLLLHETSLACSSFLSALTQGYALIRSGMAKAGLVIGADVMTRIVSWNDRRMFPILGDGAGCFVLERTSEYEDQFSPDGFFMGGNGSLADLIIVSAGGSRMPLEPNVISDPYDQRHTIIMQGNRVFKITVPLLADYVIPCALEKAALSIDDIDAIIFHQANLRIINAVVSRIGYRGLVPVNIDRVGNTTSASIPLCLHNALAAGVVRAGMRLLLVAFGGGLTWGAVIMRCEC